MEIHLSITRGHTVALFKILTLGLLLGFGIQFLFAWTAPGGPAPTGNVAGPLTTDAVPQTKAGSLTVNGGLLAPMLVDSEDSTFLVNPNALSVLSSLSVQNLNAANCDLKADASGNIYCGTDAVDSGAGSITCNWSGWACKVAANNLNGRNNCQGYVSGGHSGAYIATDSFCDPVTQKVTKMRYLQTYMD